jgi:hypothetical protein
VVLAEIQIIIKMSRVALAARAVAWTTAIIGFGYGCMTFLSPSRDDLLKVL